MSHAFTYASLANVSLIEELYEAYQVDPASVDSSWRHFFEGVEFGQYQERKEALAVASSNIRIARLIDAYRTYGHLHASVNPVAAKPSEAVRELQLATLGFEESERSALFPTCGFLDSEEATLQDILDRLEETYSGRIGVEYVGLGAPELEAWLQKQIEPSCFRPHFSTEKKKEILDRLNKAELFEIFLHTKYVGQKRFSLEGGETLIPLLHEAIELGASLGIDTTVLGMAHRGRLNVLANILGKSFSAIFSEFEDYYDPMLTEGSGDVKYHVGASATITTTLGKQVHVTLTANPSHLESVDPVVMGKVRAKQTYRGDRERLSVIPILIHGDASIAGQGVVYESMQLYRLAGYTTGGTIHIVINNQIGFTTLPKDSRSTRYCTDIARTFSAPIFHVNAEDPEGCVWAMQLAMQIRQKFACDVFIDLNCYRKYGHNEGDEPAFTQPLEYKIIRKKRSIREIYRDQLIEAGVVEQKMAEELEKEFKEGLHKELEELKLKKERTPPDAFQGVWSEYRQGTSGELFQPVETAVDRALLKEISRRSCTIPSGFHLHPKIERLAHERLKMGEGERPLDWAMAEHLAFGSLLWEGTHVRLSGQDSRRGTFSQRHAMWVDQENDTRYFPLSHLNEKQGMFEVNDSPLSEFAALGFEFGYSLSYPSALTLWEAQFGDFVNGGQVVIDQYISSSEQKWLRFSGLVMLLPHGYEGQGPEHSSGRMERFLQATGNGNLQVAIPTTPAQYFHLLRRQQKRNIRKPLIVFTHKGLLRHPQCVSALEECSSGTFEEILVEKGGRKKRRLLLCSGRIYYDLIAEREERKRDDVGLLRIEQLYPFHQEKFVEALRCYEATTECFWVQEEPMNMGAWSYMQPLLLEVLPSRMKLQYAGRNRSAATAAGSHAMHAKEHALLMEMVFGELA